MSEVLLIHGACFGAWCWQGVIAELARLGVAARAIDLPGREAVASLRDQVAAIEAALTRPAVLVGHSAAGFAISGVASAHVSGLIYVAGYVPVAGMSLAQMRRAGPSQPMAGAFEVDRVAGLFGFKPERARAMFFHDCEDASEQLCRQAIAPMEEAFAGGGGAACAAIICSEDRAIPPDYQRTMAAGMARYEIACGHAPFLALTAELAALIAKIAGGMGSK